MQATEISPGSYRTQLRRQPRHVSRLPHYRKLLRSERELLAGHLLRLTHDDRCMRFCSVVNDEHLLRYAALDDGRQRIVIGYFVGGVLRGAGELVFLGAPPWQGEAEVSLSVEREVQGRGVGAELLRRLLLVARNRGVRGVLLVALRENRRVQRLATRCGARLEPDGTEVRARFVPQWPTQASMLAESWDDGVGFASAMWSADLERMAARAAD